MNIQTKLAFVATGSMLIGACASNPDPEQVAGDDGMRCERVTDLGSNLPRKVCSTRAEREAIARQTKEEITNRQRGPEVIGDNPLPSAGN